MALAKSARAAACWGFSPITPLTVRPAGTAPTRAASAGRRGECPTAARPSRTVVVAVALMVALMVALTVALMVAGGRVAAAARDGSPTVRAPAATVAIAARRQCPARCALAGIRGSRP